MSYIDSNRPAPFGAITIYRAMSSLGDAVDLLGSAFARRRTALSAFSPAQLEDIGLSVADMPEDRRPGAFARLARAVREWNIRRRTIAELDRLTAAQLDDIGLTRGHIEELRRGRPLI